MLVVISKETGNETDVFPYGVCDNCGYEFNSEERFEYEYQFCPKCGTDLVLDTVRLGENEEQKRNLHILSTLQPRNTGGQKCDRCSRKMVNWVIAGGNSSMDGGNCTLCGEDLCYKCAQSWTEDGICAQCVEKAIEFYAKAQQQLNKHVEGRKEDEGKVRWDLVPWEQFEEVAKVLTFGANKYADHNWQKLSKPTERYFSALLRHLVAWQNGEQLDKGSGLFHLAQVACNALFLLWFDMREDRDTPKSVCTCGDPTCLAG